MITRIFYYMIIFVLIAGCTKDETDTDVNGEFDYFIRYEVNGKKVEYKFEIKNNIPEATVTGGVNENVTDVVFPQFEGEIFTSYINAMVGLDPESAELFQVAIFTEDLISANVNYAEENTRQISASLKKGANFYSTLDDNSSDFEITWTSISNTEARGNFSGTVFHDRNSSSLEIVDGEFFVLISNQLLNQGF